MIRGRDYRFAFRPKWLAGHVIVIIAVIVFVSMGFWQLRRLDERQEFNALLVSRTAEAARPLDDVLSQYGPAQEDLELRNVTVSGEYRPSEETILLSRSHNGLSGHHVLTPLYLADGRVLVVDRGWVPIDMDGPGSAAALAPAGTVDVYGFLRKTERRGSFGPVDPAEGTLLRVARVDLDRLDQQTVGQVIPVYMQLQKQRPAQQGQWPALVPLPEPSEGSHRGYAVQWFLFAGVVLVGYPLLLSRTAEDNTGPAPYG